MAQRADKWWRSVWHVQMLMQERGRGEWGGRDMNKAKPLNAVNLLTVDVGRAFLKAQSPTKTKSNLGRSEDTNDGDTR
jgi:hypothetical protein